MNSLMKHYKEMKDVRFFPYNIQGLTKQKKKKRTLITLQRTAA